MSTHISSLGSATVYQCRLEQLQTALKSTSTPTIDSLKGIPLPALTADDEVRIRKLLREAKTDPALKISFSTRDEVIPLGFDLLVDDIKIKTEEHAKKLKMGSSKFQLVGSKVASALGVGYFKRALEAIHIRPLSILDETGWDKLDKILQMVPDIDFQLQWKDASRSQLHEIMLNICNLAAQKFKQLLATSKEVQTANKRIQLIKKDPTLTSPQHLLDTVTRQTIELLGLTNFLISRNREEKDYEITILSMGLKKKVDFTFKKGTPDFSVNKSHWSDRDSMVITIDGDDVYLECLRENPWEYIFAMLSGVYEMTAPLESNDVLRQLTKSRRGLTCGSILREQEAFHHFLFDISNVADFKKYLEKHHGDVPEWKIDDCINLYFHSVKLNRRIQIYYIINPILFELSVATKNPFYLSILSAYQKLSSEEFHSLFQWMAILQSAPVTGLESNCWKLRLPTGAYCLIPVNPHLLFSFFPEEAVSLISGLSITSKLRLPSVIQQVIEQRAATLTTKEDISLKEFGLRILLAINAKQKISLIAELGLLNKTLLLEVYPEFHSPVLQNTILELASSIEEDKVMLGVELWKRNQDRETTLKLFELFVEKKDRTVLQIIPKSYGKEWIKGIDVILSNPEVFSLTDSHHIWESIDAAHVASLSRQALENILSRHGRVGVPFLMIPILRCLPSQELQEKFTNTILEKTPELYKPLVANEIKFEKPAAPKAVHVKNPELQEAKERRFIQILQLSIKTKDWHSTRHILLSLPQTAHKRPEFRDSIDSALEHLEGAAGVEACRLVLEIYKIEEYQEEVQSLCSLWIINKLDIAPVLETAILYIVTSILEKNPKMRSHFLERVLSKNCTHLLREFIDPVFTSLQHEVSTFIDIYQRYVFEFGAIEHPSILFVFKQLLEKDPCDIRLERLWSAVKKQIPGSLIQDWLVRTIAQKHFERSRSIFIKYCSIEHTLDKAVIAKFLETFSADLFALNESELMQFTHLFDLDSIRLFCDLVKKLDFERAGQALFKLPISWIKEHRLISHFIGLSTFQDLAKKGSYTDISAYASLLLGDYGVSEKEQISIARCLLQNKDSKVRRIGSKIILFCKDPEEALLSKALEEAGVNYLEDIPLYISYSPSLKSITSLSISLQIQAANIYGQALYTLAPKETKAIESEYLRLLNAIPEEKRREIQLQTTIEKYPVVELFETAIVWIAEAESADCGLDAQAIILHLPKFEKMAPFILKSVFSLVKQVKDQESAAKMILKALPTSSLKATDAPLIEDLLSYITDWSLDVTAPWICRLVSISGTEDARYKWYGKIFERQAAKNLLVLEQLCSNFLGLSLDTLSTKEGRELLEKLANAVSQYEKSAKKLPEKFNKTIKKLKEFTVVINYVFHNRALNASLRDWKTLHLTYDDEVLIDHFSKSALVYVRKELIDSHERRERNTKIISELGERVIDILVKDKDLAFTFLSRICMTSLFVGPQARSSILEIINHLLDPSLTEMPTKMSMTSFVSLYGTKGSKAKISSSSGKQSKLLTATEFDKLSSCTMYYTTSLQSIADSMSVPLQYVMPEHSRAFDKLFAEILEDPQVSLTGIIDLIGRLNKLQGMPISKIEYVGFLKNTVILVMNFIRSCGFEITEDASTPTTADMIVYYTKRYINPCIKKLKIFPEFLKNTEVSIKARVKICKALYVITHSVSIGPVDPHWIEQLSLLRIRMGVAIFLSDDWLVYAQSLDFLKCVQNNPAGVTREDALLEFNTAFIECISTLSRLKDDKDSLIKVALVQFLLCEYHKEKEKIIGWKEIKEKLIDKAIKVLGKKGIKLEERERLRNYFDPDIVKLGGPIRL